MTEVIIDTSAEIDTLLRELHRLKETPKAAKLGQVILTWGDICADSTLQLLFKERLSSVMDAAKNQGNIHFPSECLLIGAHEEEEVDILAPPLRRLPTSASFSRSRRKERNAAFREAKIQLLEAHRMRMLQLVMQNVELSCGTREGPHGAAGVGREEKTADGADDADSPPHPSVEDDGNQKIDGDGE